MRQLYGRGMHPSHVHPAGAETLHLSKELPQAGPSLVIDKCFGYKAHLKPSFFHSDAELNIFCQAVKGKATGHFKNFSSYAHIKTSRLKMSGLIFTTPDTTGGQYG